MYESEISCLLDEVGTLRTEVESKNDLETKQNNVDLEIKHDLETKQNNVDLERKHDLET